MVNGGTLTGTGLVDPSTVTINSGTFAPGTIGTPGTFMTITGSLAFASGATYAVSLNPSTSTYAFVNGTASLAGTVSASFASGSYVSKQYTILTATGGLGGTTFASLTNSQPAGGRERQFELRRQRRLSEPHRRLHQFHRAQWQPAERRQRADQLFQCDRRPSGGILRVERERSDAGRRRGGDRRRARRVQADGSVFRSDARSVRRWQERHRLADRAAARRAALRRISRRASRPTSRSPMRA